MHCFNAQVFYDTVAGFLGWYYTALALANVVAALRWWRGTRRVAACLGLAAALVFGCLAALAATANPAIMPCMPLHVQVLIDALSGPVTYSVGATIVLAILFRQRRFFVKPVVAWSMLNAASLVLGLSLTNGNFYAIVSKPDNVPIVAMVFLLGFFTWLGTYQAVRNDDRRAGGLPPVEQERGKIHLVWPDLVYIELICMVAVTAALIFWGLALKAPLEQVANSTSTPNPSKAPWYFVGLQEMLVYFDPWLAGVVLPTLVLVGLIAIPYLDFNKAGNGYYTIAERKFSYLVFQFGFLLLWILLILIGTFLRGPNWTFFGPYEAWDPQKVVALDNMNLSEYFWVDWLGRALPQAPPGSGVLSRTGWVLCREAPGLISLLAYFFLLPPLLATTVFKKFYPRMGRLRYLVMVTLLLLMMLLPIKMALRWTVNLKDLVSIPEILLNI